MSNILEMASRRAKRGEIWDSGVLVQYIWDTFDLSMLKVILGSFIALAIFRKIRFLQRCFCYTYASFSCQLFISVPCDRPHKSYVLEV